MQDKSYVWYCLHVIVLINNFVHWISQLNDQHYNAFVTAKCYVMLFLLFVLCLQKML